MRGKLVLFKVGSLTSFVAGQFYSSRFKGRPGHYYKKDFAFASRCNYIMALLLLLEIPYHYKDVRNFITGQFYASRIKRRPEYFKGHTGVTRLSYGTHCGTFLGVPISRTNQWPG